MPSTKKKREMLSAVYSFRNEEDVLEELIARMEAVLDQLGLDYELIFVNDDSTDRSLEILVEQNRRNPAVKVLTMSRCFGVEECWLTGLEYASGDLIVTMDSDLQDPPELIPDLLAKIREGADVAYTVRTKRLAESAMKMWITRMAYKAIRLGSEIDLPENSGDFRMMTRQVLDHVLKLRETDPYIRGMVRWVGFRQEPVYYERHARGGGVGHFPLLGSLNPYKTFIKGLTSFSSAPIYLILVVGLLSFLGAVSGLLIDGALILSGAGSETAAWILFALALWGSILVAIGVVGIYAIRTYKDVRFRPRTIVADTIGIDGKPPRA